MDDYRARLMSLTPGERMLMAGRMYAAAKELVIAGLPDEVKANPADLREQVFLRFYGRDFAEPERSRICRHLRNVWDKQDSGRSPRN